MDIKARVANGLKSAMRDKDQTRVCTLRLINAAIKDVEISKRGCEEGVTAACSEKEILGILDKMIKQRNESIRAYEECGRLELAEQEREETEIIAEFMPRPLNADEKEAAIRTAIADAQAGSLRDMGRVMGLLKERHAGRMDFTAVGPEVRARLAS